MEYFKKYGEFLNESFLNETNDEQEALKKIDGALRPKPHKFNDINFKPAIKIYKPVDSEDLDDINKYIVFNPETGNFVTIKAFDDYYKKLEAGELTEATKDKVLKTSPIMKKTKGELTGLKKAIKSKVIPKEESSKIKKNIKKTLDTKKISTENKLTESDYKSAVKSGKLKEIQWGKDKRITFNEMKIGGKTVESVLKNKLPKSSVQALERLLNLTGKPKILEVTANAGAGQIQSQLGELVTAAGVCMNDKEFNDFSKQLSERFTKLNNNNTIYTESWMQSAIGQRNAAHVQLDYKFGKGKWSIESSCWDIREDVESTMFDNYDSKEASTDYFVRVKTPKGPYIMENSLKKNSIVFAYNGSTGDLKHQMMLAHPDKSIRKEYTNKYRELEKLISKYGPTAEMKANTPENKLAKNTSKELLANLKSMRDVKGEKGPNLNKKIDQGIYLSGQKSDWIEYSKKVATKLDTIKNIKISPEALSGKNKEYYGIFSKVQAYLKKNKNAKFPDMSDSASYSKFIAEVNGDDSKSNSKYMQKTMVAIAIVMNDQGKSNPLSAFSKEIFSKREKAYKDFSENIVKEFESNKNFKEALNIKFKEVIPVVGILEGNENMQMGGVPIFKEVLLNAFGINNVDEFQDDMTIKLNSNGDPEIVLKARGKRKQISIAKMTVRQKGLFYESSVGMELAFTDEFFCISLNSAYEVSKSKDKKFEFSKIYDSLPLEDKKKANKCKILKDNKLVESIEYHSDTLFNSYSQFLDNI